MPQGTTAGGARPQQDRGRCVGVRLAAGSLARPNDESALQTQEDEPQRATCVRSRHRSLLRLRLPTRLLLDGQEEFELRRQLLLRVQAVGEIDAADAAVGVDLHTQGFDVVGAVGAAREVGEIELDLVPSLIQAHGHCANERLHARRALVVGRAEPAAHVLVVENHHLEREVLLQVFDDHHEEGELDAQGILAVDGAGDEGGGDVCAHDLKHRRANVIVRDALDVPIHHRLVPDLQRLAPDTVEDAQKARLECVLEHGGLCCATG
eukprot:CAMPEP_0185165888 /NCGR_PEP_ID=MMETSP1139-20130426/11606_1 /TAXON_ID=298111 /ORGANISM="Pavlova sp., Strain CCMP459" /LENGTH=264 /DNA_ID=CAMNT_0027731309 /DNA_START=764 /DNA_END=1556 /DNA_ORIENTATION=-